MCDSSPIKIRTRVFHLILPFFILVSFISPGSHLRGGYIRIITANSNGVSYRIEIKLYVDTGSTVKFGGGEINYGDGSPIENFNTSDVDYQEIIDEKNEIAINIIIREHEFPGPGIYTVSFREFNRNGDIINMTNSVNTPFYIESKIVIDPFYGLNSSPDILSDIFCFGRPKALYTFNIGAYDPDGDSISYELVACKQNREISVAGFHLPFSWNRDSTDILSKLSIDHISGLIYWEYPYLEGEYNAAINIKEWRYLRDFKEWVEIGNMTYDFQIIIWNTENNPPMLNIPQDTVVMANSEIRLDFHISDPDNDTLRIKQYGTIFKSPYSQPSFTPPDTLLNQSPVHGFFSWKPTSENIDKQPYSLFIDVADYSIFSLRSQFTTYIWVVNEESCPIPPSNLSAISESYHTITLSWIDNSDDEAGFVIERADDYFPEFRRITHLPSNISSYVDRSILPNRDYIYRIKALGSEGPGYSDNLYVSKDIVLGTNYNTNLENIILYPNPVRNYLHVKFEDHEVGEFRLEIINSTGKLLDVIDINTMNQYLIQVPTHSYPSGIYFVRILSKKKFEIQKFIKE